MYNLDINFQIYINYALNKKQSNKIEQKKKFKASYILGQMKYYCLINIIAYYMCELYLWV